MGKKKGEGEGNGREKTNVESKNDDMTMTQGFFSSLYDTFYNVFLHEGFHRDIATVQHIYFSRITDHLKKLDAIRDCTDPLHFSFTNNKVFFNLLNGFFPRVKFHQTLWKNLLGAINRFDKLWYTSGKKTIRRNCNIFQSGPYFCRYYIVYWWCFCFWLLGECEIFAGLTSLNRKFNKLRLKPYKT